jgi:hypothetical protein
VKKLVSGPSPAMMTRPMSTPMLAMVFMTFLLGKSLVISAITRNYCFSISYNDNK